MIDGTSQPGYTGGDLIQIDGSKAGPNCDGLVLSGGASVVRGLIISGLQVPGLCCMGNREPGGGERRHRPHGTSSQPNAEGIKIVGSSLNTIGGTLAGARNLISGNLGNGIEIVQSGTGATGNEILGNLIGTTAGGQQVLANKGDGILVNGAAANLVGDSVPGCGNVLSGNLRNGNELPCGRPLSVRSLVSPPAK